MSYLKPGYHNIEKVRANKQGVGVGLCELFLSIQRANWATYQY